MAVSTVGPGRDYETLALWRASLPSTLTEVEEAECYGFEDTDAVLFQSIVTSAANYIRIYAAPGHECNGVSRDRSGTGYQLKVTGERALGIQVDHFRIEGIEIQSTDLNLAVAITGGLSVGSDIRLTNSILISHATQASGNYNCNFSQANVNLTATNCIFLGNGEAFDTRVCASAVFDHCLLFSDGTPCDGAVSDGEATFTNCVSVGSDPDFRNSGGSPSLGSHNASEDTTSNQFSSSLTGLVAASEWEDPTTVTGSFDFTLKSINSLAGAGTGSLANDIAGNPYGSPSDIGPFSASGGPTTVSIDTIPATIDTGETGIVITGTGFGTTEGTVTQGGIPLNVTNWEAETITVDSVTIESTFLRYGTTEFEVTEDGGESDTADVEVLVPDNYDTVILASLAGTNDRLTSPEGLTVGDLIIFEDTLGHPGGSYPVVVNDNGTITVTGGPVTDGSHDFEAKVHNGQGWGEWWTTDLDFSASPFGSASGLLEEVSGSATGEGDGVSGDASATLEEITGDAEGESSLQGGASGILTVVRGVSFGAAHEEIFGVGLGKLEEVTGSATGDHAPPFAEGDASGVIQEITGSSPGTFIPTAEGDASGILSLVTGSGTGVSIDPVEGDAVGDLTPVRARGLGETINNNTGDASGVLSLVEGTGTGIAATRVTGDASGTLEIITGMAVGSVLEPTLWTIQPDNATIWTIED